MLRSAAIIAIDCEGVALSATGELTLVQVSFALAAWAIFTGNQQRILNNIEQSQYSGRITIKR